MHRHILMTLAFWSVAAFATPPEASAQVGTCWKSVAVIIADPGEEGCMGQMCEGAHSGASDCGNGWDPDKCASCNPSGSCGSSLLDVKADGTIAMRQQQGAPEGTGLLVSWMPRESRSDGSFLDAPRGAAPLLRACDGALVDPRYDAATGVRLRAQARLLIL